MSANNTSSNTNSQQNHNSTRMYDQTSYGNSQNDASAYQQGYQSWQPEGQAYSHPYTGAAQPSQQSQGQITSQRPQYPYRPRPSPPSGDRGDSADRFCEHGAAFDCGYGCHKNSPLNTATSSPYNSPSPPAAQSSASGYASLPYRMPPGPTTDSTYGTNQPMPNPPSQTSYPMGAQAPPTGQQGYASFPARMHPNQMGGPSSDRTPRRT